jgi:hypothetical protein
MKHEVIYPFLDNIVSFAPDKFFKIFQFVCFKRSATFYLYSLFLLPLSNSARPAKGVFIEEDGVS